MLTRQVSSTSSATGLKYWQGLICPSHFSCSTSLPIPSPLSLNPYLEETGGGIQRPFSSWSERNSLLLNKTKEMFIEVFKPPLQPTGRKVNVAQACLWMFCLLRLGCLSETDCQVNHSNSVLYHICINIL